LFSLLQRTVFFIFLYKIPTYVDPNFWQCRFGISAQSIIIEVHINPGVGYHLVGLPDNAVKECNHRIAAFTKGGYG